MKSPVVLGLDLSLRSPAAVLAPRDWKPGDWGGLARSTLATKRTGPERLAEIRRWLVDFLPLAGPTSPTHCYVEDYAYDSAGRVAQLGEGCGVVQLLLWERFDVRCELVAASTARKTLLGTIRKKDLGGAKIKDHVNHQLARMGANFATLDEGDAFVVMNHGRALLGLPHVGVGS